MQLQRVDAFGQLDPDEVAALRTRGTGALGKMPRHGLQHLALLQGQLLAELAQVAIEAAFLQVGGDGGLVGAAVARLVVSLLRMMRRV